MTSTIQRWLVGKWRLFFNADETVGAYASVPDTVVQHLVDNTYCTICESNDPIALATHNGRRAVVHEILVNIDLARNPSKYNVQQQALAMQTSQNGDFPHGS